ncbi:hypothetical protein [Cryptosporangium minutisporangium]|uniref:Uncharacterized protein n=1 Tax=Cryptosporangium minutisporangium TaxID=113569 RepID=A0ABP6T9L0_9ACTN
MTDLPPPSRDLPPGAHTALRSRVLAATYEEEAPRRRRLLPLAAAAAVLVVVFGAIGVLRSTGERPMPTVSGPGTPAPTAVAPTGVATTGVPPTTVVAPAAFEPLFTRLAPGWLPDGATVESHGVSRRSEGFRAADRSGVEVEVDVELLLRGGRSVLDPGLPGARPGPDVNGAPSTWVTGAGNGGGWLRWEWAPGATAVLLVKGVPDAERVAARVAESLRPGTRRSVAMPFTMVRPAGLPLASHSVVEWAGGGYEARFQFGPGTGPVRSINVTWIPARYATNYPPNVTVGGRDANVRTEGEYLVVWQRFGPDVVEVHCRTQKSGSVDAVRAECLRTAGTLRPAGTNEQPSTWSTEPLR